MILIVFCSGGWRVSLTRGRGPVRTQKDAGRSLGPLSNSDPTGGRSNNPGVVVWKKPCRLLE